MYMYAERDPILRMKVVKVTSPFAQKICCTIMSKGCMLEKQHQSETRATRLVI